MLVITREVSSDELDIVAGICLDPSVPKTWREAMAPCMEVRKEWLTGMMKQGLQVIVAIGPNKTKMGLVEICPIHLATEPVSGRNGLFINCMWVLPPKWKQGVGKALIEHAIENARPSGGLSVLAYGGDRWFGYFQYMPASFFKQFGFSEVDRDETRVLLYLDLGGKEKPSLIQPKVMPVDEESTSIEVLFNSQCPWSGWMANRACREFGKYDVAINTVNTDDRKIMEKYGLSRGVLLNGFPILKRMSSVKEIKEKINETASLKRQKKRQPK
jgi:GNAT superfamily N-acetyltransferase